MNTQQVLQHKQENATFNRTSCKIDATRNLNLPNSIQLDDQTFRQYAECLAMKMNKRYESFLYIKWWASCIKKTLILSH